MSPGHYVGQRGSRSYRLLDPGHVVRHDLPRAVRRCFRSDGDVHILQYVVIVAMQEAWVRGCVMIAVLVVVGRVGGSVCLYYARMAAALRLVQRAHLAELIRPLIDTCVEQLGCLRAGPKHVANRFLQRPERNGFGAGRALP